jgi:hypothetical protein
VLLVVSVRLSVSSLALFLIGGALIGAGAGAVFKGTTGIVLEVSAPDTVLVFAILVGLGVSASGWALLGHRSNVPAPQMDSAP